MNTDPFSKQPVYILSATNCYT